MAALGRRLPGTRALVASVDVYNVRSLATLRPLYSVVAAKRDSLEPHGAYRQRRYANTSSGFFAQSTHADQISRNASHRSPTIHEDSDHLPPLPVPELGSTLDILRESISPIAMNSVEFARTLQLIEKFSESAGPKLDLLLRSKANQTKNWMTHDWWTQEIYLKSRKPLVIDSSPAMIYPVLPFEVNNRRALVNVTSQLISGLIDFKLSLFHGYNPEATSAENECRLDPNTCYHQYKRIFGSTRLPGEEIDTFEAKSLSDSNETDPISLIVSHRGKFFEIQLTNIDDEKSRVIKLATIIDKIISESEHNGQGIDGAGVLTTAGRKAWANNYKLLDSESIAAIRDAQFVVCIDTLASEPEDFSKSILDSSLGSEAHLGALGRQVLHGDSTNVGNRWFDKALQLIVVADSSAERFLGAGINYEHTFGEGVLVARMIEHSYDKTVEKARETSGSNFFAKQQIAPLEPAIFRQLRMIDEDHMREVEARIQQAKLDFVAHMSQFGLSYLDYKRYGSNAIKSYHFSPDSWFQVALQLAYYRTHKRLGVCYESAATRRFAYGRTEIIRSLTKEVAHFCTDPRFDTMQAAIKSHKAYVIAASNAQAIDRVLMGYKMTFKELRSRKWLWGLPAPFNGTKTLESLKVKQTNRSGEEGQGFDIEDLFSDEEMSTISAFFNSELIQRSQRFSLSTSQVSSIHPDIYMCYGPLLADGYGCCYNITGQKFVAAITANSSNQSFSCEVDKLNAGIAGSLDTMRDFVEESRQKS